MGNPRSLVRGCVRPFAVAITLLLAVTACESPAPFVAQTVDVVPSATLVPTQTAEARPTASVTPDARPTVTQPTATAQVPTSTTTATAQPEPPTSTRVPTATATSTAAPSTVTPAAPEALSPTKTPASTATPVVPIPSPTASSTPADPSQDLDVEGSLTYIDDSGTLWLINADGSGKTFLALEVDASQPPIWSPKKQRVAFREQKTINNTPVKVWRVMEVNDQGRYELIARLQDSEDFTWSPNGRTALISEPFKGFVEYNISTQRSEDVFDTFGGALDRSPELSPNGKKLAFVHYELSVQYYVGFIRAYDDQLKPVTYDDTFTKYFHPTVALVDAGTAIERNQQFRFLWTPDGKQVIYAVRQPSQTSGSIYAAGLAFKIIASGVLDPVSTNIDLSNDGDTVVFVSSQGLMTAPVDGRYAPRLLNSTVSSSPRWSPDDAYVAVVDSQGIVLVSTDGKTSTVIPDTIGAVSLAWVPLP